MKIAFRILAVALLCLPMACAKTERNKENAPAASIEKSRRTLFTYNYSGEEIWRKGINTKTGNQFFFNIDKSKPIPISIGERLEFKTTGVARIIAINRMESSGYSSIFVIVDRPLSPDGDGYPNPIYVLADKG